MTTPTPPPWWERPLIGFDTETTGPDPLDARIVTATLVVVDELGHVITGHDWLADPGIEIPEGATAVHGVTTARARAEGIPTWRMLHELVAQLGKLMSSWPLVAYNATYDLTVVRRELERHKLDGLLELFDELPRAVIDPLVLDKGVDTYRRGKRTLTAASQLYGVELVDAHTSTADALAAAHVARAIGRRYAQQLPSDLEQLYTLQVDWKRQQSASLERYFRRTRPDAVVDGSWPVIR